MTLPTPSDVHVNAPLTDMSVQYAQSLTKFAADRIFPVVTSSKESNSYFVFDKSYWARDQMKARGLGAAAADAGFGISTASFQCIPYAVKKAIPDRLRRNADAPLNLDRSAMRFVTQLERIRREKAFASACLTTNVWSTDYAGVASDSPSTGQWEQWDREGSTPIENVRALATEVELLTLGAARPNVLAVGQEVWDVLADHPDITDRLKYGGQMQGTLAQATPQMIAAVMGLDEIVIMSAIEESAAEGAASAGAYIAGKKALLVYRNPNPALEDVSGGYTICQPDIGGTPAGWRIKQYRAAEELASDMVEIESCFTHKVVAADAGAYIADIIG